MDAINDIRGVLAEKGIPVVELNEIADKIRNFVVTETTSGGIVLKILDKKETPHKEHFNTYPNRTIGQWIDTNIASIQISSFSVIESNEEEEEET